MGDHLGTYVQRWLHAFAEAGYLPPAQDLQPLIGPNGAVMWTETTRVPGSAVVEGHVGNSGHVAGTDRDHAPR